jgi:hypothetical protein
MYSIPKNTGFEPPVLRYFGIMKKAGNTGIPVSVLPVLDALELAAPQISSKNRQQRRVTDGNFFRSNTVS